jgi:hypothetical protein
LIRSPWAASQRFAALRSQSCLAVPSGQDRLRREVETIFDDRLQQRHGKVALQVGLPIDREQLLGRP